MIWRTAWLAMSMGGMPSCTMWYLSTFASHEGVPEPKPNVKTLSWVSYWRCYESRIHINELGTRPVKDRRNAESIRAALLLLYHHNCTSLISRFHGK